MQKSQLLEAGKLTGEVSLVAETSNLGTFDHSYSARTNFCLNIRGLGERVIQESLQMRTLIQGPWQHSVRSSFAETFAGEIE
jgi:hypothetical protein